MKPSYLLTAVLILTCVILFIAYYRSATRYSPTILKITQPVTGITGTVVGTGNNTIVLKLENPARLTDTTAPTLVPENEIVYTVRITGDTAFAIRSNQAYPLPGFPDFRTDGIKSLITPGELLSVTTKKDLRLLRDRAFTADSVTLIIAKPLFGQLSGRTGNGLQVTSGNRTFTVTTVPETDYYAATAQGLRSTSSASLKSDDSLTVFAVGNGSPPYVALRIIDAPPPVPTAAITPPASIPKPPTP